MILPKERDPRLITLRRGGTLTDADHHLLALWAADCAEHVLPLFEAAQPQDDRVRLAVEAGGSWVKGNLKMSDARKAAFAAHAAARDIPQVKAAQMVARAAGQAAAVAHVAAHQLGAAAYAIKAVRESLPQADRDEAGRLECAWQHTQLPDAIRALVLDDQKRRNALCWFVFTC